MGIVSDTDAVVKFSAKIPSNEW